MNGTFNRRMLLRGLGGAVVAVPFLSSLAGRATRAQSSTGPKRLIVYFTHYGCVTDGWFPALSDGPLGMTDYAAMQTLYPLAPYADKLLMAKGGTAEVTCYGKYDDTTLFNTNTPAVIKNPGEYSELRAS